MRLWLKRAAIAAASLALLAAPAASAQVPDPYARELAQHLARINQIVGEQNYALAAGPFSGGLNARTARRFPVTLRVGQEYRMVGVCDSRCGDLDLRLFDESGVLVTEDTLRDNVPVLTVRPAVSGVHTIEVVMYECRAEPCWFAFNVYSR